MYFKPPVVPGGSSKKWFNSDTDFSGQESHVLYCTWAIAEDVLEKKGIYTKPKGEGQIM
jgi:hypothetical protein